MAVAVTVIITYKAKLLNADWLRQRAFFVNHEGTFGWARFICSELTKLYKFSNSAQVWPRKRWSVFGFRNKWRRFVAGVMSSKAVFEIANRLVYSKLTEKDWKFIACGRGRGNVEVCLVLSYFKATFPNWCPLDFTNLSFVFYRRLKGKSHIRL